MKGLPNATRVRIVTAAAFALAACSDSTAPVAEADFVVENIARFWEAAQSYQSAHPCLGAAARSRGYDRAADKTVVIHEIIEARDRGGLL